MQTGSCPWDWIVSVYALTAAYLQSLFHDVRFCICAQVTAGTFVTGVLLQLRYRVTVNLDCRFGDYEFVRPFLDVRHAVSTW